MATHLCKIDVTLNSNISAIQFNPLRTIDKMRVSLFILSLCSLLSPALAAMSWTHALNHIRLYFQFQIEALKPLGERHLGRYCAHYSTKKRQCTQWAYMKGSLPSGDPDPEAYTADFDTFMEIMDSGTGTLAKGPDKGRYKKEWNNAVIPSWAHGDGRFLDIDATVLNLVQRQYTEDPIPRFYSDWEPARKSDTMHQKRIQIAQHWAKECGKMKYETFRTYQTWDLPPNIVEAQLFQQLEAVQERLSNVREGIFGRTRLNLLADEQLTKQGFTVYHKGLGSAPDGSELTTVDEEATKANAVASGNKKAIKAINEFFGEFLDSDEKMKKYRETTREMEKATEIYRAASYGTLK